MFASMQNVFRCGLETLLAFKATDFASQIRFPNLSDNPALRAGYLNEGKVRAAMHTFKSAVRNRSKALRTFLPLVAETQHNEPSQWTQQKAKQEPEVAAAFRSACEVTDDSTSDPDGESDARIHNALALCARCRGPQEI